MLGWDFKSMKPNLEISSIFVERAVKLFWKIWSLRTTKVESQKKTPGVINEVEQTLEKSSTENVSSSVVTTTKSLCTTRIINC